NVEADLDLRVRGDFGQGLVENITVDQSDETELLEHRHEFASGDDPAVAAAHAQQAFVVINLAGRRRYDRLEREHDAILAQRRLNLFADRQAAPLALSLLVGHPVMRIAIASGALGLR